MRTLCHWRIVLWFGPLVAVFVAIAHSPGATRAAEAAGSLAATGGQITIKGMVLNNVHTGEKDKSVFVYALDGPPQIKAEFEKIMAEYYPDKGLDGDAARELLNQLTARLKYFIDGPLAEKLVNDATYNARQVMAVTGVIERRDSKKWITVSKCEPTTYQYPAKMLAPDKPFVMPDRGPLLLKITGIRPAEDQLALPPQQPKPAEATLKCIWVGPGRFFMGEPYYRCPHWQSASRCFFLLGEAFLWFKPAATCSVECSPALRKPRRADLPRPWPVAGVVRRTSRSRLYAAHVTSIS